MIVFSLNEARDTMRCGMGAKQILLNWHQLDTVFIPTCYLWISKWSSGTLFCSDPGKYEAIMKHQPLQFGWDEKCHPIYGHMEQDTALIALLQTVHCKSCKT